MISWEDAYKTTPPWDIGRSQPAFVELVDSGEFNQGIVLDVGCGTGENALYLAANGFSVAGVDLSRRAIVAAKAKAGERNLKADFRPANALSLGFRNGYFDNAIDSGLFHTFNDKGRVAFARGIARVLTTDGRYFMLCFSNKEPVNWGGPRRITRGEIETTFSPTLQYRLHQGRIFCNQNPQQRWESLPDIGNKKVRLTLLDTLRTSCLGKYSTLLFPS
jgi:SAM-dependent methyltransferase